MLKNKIISGDVIKEMNKMEAEYFDLIIADPPYNQNIAKWDSYDSKVYWKFMNEWIEQAAKKLKPGGSIWVFNNPYNSGMTVPILEKNGLEFQNWITWYKKDGFGAPKYKFRTKQETILFFTKSSRPSIFNRDSVREPYKSKDRLKAATTKGIIKNGKRWYPNKNGALRSDIWEFSSQRHKEKQNGKVVKHWHETPKPHDLIQTIIKTSSNKESIILDLFSGSGATSIVSKKMGIDSIGIEKNKTYVRKIKEALKNV